MPGGVFREMIAESRPLNSKIMQLLARRVRDLNERIIEQVKLGASPAEILAGMARVAAEGIAASHTGTPNSHARHWLINYDIATLHDTIATYIVAMVEATNSTPAA